MYNYSQINSKEPLHYDLLDDLRAMHASKEMPGQGESCDFDSYEYYRMLYIASGTCVVYWGSKKRILKSHDAFFMFPGESYQVVFNTTTNELYWVELRGQRVRQFLELLDVHVHEPSLSGISNPDFFRIIRIMKSAYSNISLPDFFYYKGYLYQLCSILLNEFSFDGWKKIAHTDPIVQYSGSWMPWPSKSDIAKGFYYTHAPRSFLEFTFRGCGVKWYGVMNYDCGIADVLLDGNYSVSVDLYSPERLSRQLLFSQNRLNEGEHVVKIICTGKKNHMSMGFDINLECLEIRQEQSCTHHEIQTKSRMVNRAIAFMRENYSNEITVSELAAMYGVSRSYFTTVFKGETGVPPKEYLCRVRMDQAKVYLAETSYPIMKIAKLCGYQDVMYFMRRFKHREAVTPSEFRKISQST